MNRSNNDIMWDCLVDIFDGKQNATSRVDRFIMSYVLNDGKEVEENFSHDNWLAVLCWLHKFDDVKFMFPTFGHHTLHPMNFIKFLWMKYPLAYPLRIVTMFEMLLGSTILARKTESGKLHTSGILLDYYLCKSYDMKFMMKVLTFIVKRRSWHSWLAVFHTYHGDPRDYNYKVFEAFQRSRVK